MSEIDWSKAPEGATHFDPSDDQGMPWMKFDNGRWYAFDGGWLGPLGADDEFIKDNAGAHCIPRPTQWRGPEDGLPPVGTVCEADADTRPGGYEPCLVVWHDPAPDDDCHPVLALFKSRHATKFDEPEWCSDFRPLKSDKDRAIDAAVAATILKDGPRIRAALSDIYDAGLLRLPEGQS